ncbi:EamA family transporter [uncultured Methylobacterium sp.]|uniref:EamA family transporter n=1 Tax=uncultured Methylobacterium sp. TaxID=157278 RepID=UPI0025992720|nr:EamA family transporter [uncultured Methylobacterium sp.]
MSRLARVFSSARLPVLLPIASLFSAMACVASGTALSKALFTAVGAEGATALRIVVSALCFIVLWRPWRLPALGRRGIICITLYGAAIGGMALLFYLAIQTLPLGIAMALQFCGPLVITAAAVRSVRDACWIACAAAGIGMLLNVDSRSLTSDVAGFLYIAGSAACWALYIWFGKMASQIDERQALSLGMVVASLVVIPFGVGQTGRLLVDPAILSVGLAAAILSCALPYGLEMFALKRLPRSVFGILVSGYPIIYALAGRLMLGEDLTSRQCLGIALISVAAGGSTLTHLGARGKASPGASVALRHRDI